MGPITEEDIPVGQSRVLNDNGIVKQTYSRTSVGEGIFEMFDSKNDDRVFKAIVYKDGKQPPHIEYIDLDFWTIKVDGEVVDSIPSSGGDTNFDLETKVVNISSE